MAPEIPVPGPRSSAGSIRSLGQLRQSSAWRYLPNELRAPTDMMATAVARGLEKRRRGGVAGIAEQFCHRRGIRNLPPRTAPVPWFSTVNRTIPPARVTRHAYFGISFPVPYVWSLIVSVQRIGSPFLACVSYFTSSTSGTLSALARLARTVRVGSCRAASSRMR